MIIQNYWANPAKWPIDFADKVFLIRAVIEIGKAKFGDQWTGDELNSELMLPLSKEIPTNPSGRTLAAYQILKAVRPDLLAAEENENQISVSNGFIWHKWTQEQWNTAFEIIETKNNEKKFAVTRLANAKQLTLNLLQTGQLQTFTRPKVGGTFSGPLDPSVWNTELWWNRFQWGQIDPGKPFTNAVGGDTFEYIFLGSQGIQKSVDEIRLTNSPLDAFFSTGFPRVDAVLQNLKGPKFIPKNCIKLRDALSKVGLAKIQNWSGQETDEASWHDEADKDTVNYARWQDAATWFQHELFEGKITASRMQKDGTVVGVAKETFGQDQIQHIFRKHQEEAWILFVDERELSELLLSPAALSEFSGLDVQTAGLPTLTEDQLEHLYTKRVQNWPSGKTPPSRDDDYKYLCSISNEVTHKMSREVRARLAPPNWVTGGRRKLDN
jgi:hypothetical protein